MNINEAIIEIEKLMMYRGEMPEEGQLREVLEKLITHNNIKCPDCGGDMIPEKLFCMECGYDE